MSEASESVQAALEAKPSDTFAIVPTDQARLLIREYEWWKRKALLAGQRYFDMHTELEQLRAEVGR